MPVLPNPIVQGVGEIVELFITQARVFHAGWAPLPAWASSLVRLGAQISREGEEPGPLTFALVLPTRAFAAVLCATGVVLQRIAVSLKIDPAGTLARLSAAPVGTMVTYRTKDIGALFRGALVQCTIAGVTFKPSVTSTIWINKHFAHAIELSEASDTVLPELATSQAPPKSSALLKALLGPRLVTYLQAPSRLECGIVGTEAALRSEVKGVRLGVERPDGDIVEGTIQDVLQVRRFVGKSGIFRSDVIAATGSRKTTALSDSPGVAIFDGVLSFLKYGAHWPTATRLVLLDRTDRRLRDALAEVNREYLQRSADGVALEHSALKLPGTETLSYRTSLP